MLNVREATKIAHENHPDGDIQAIVVYKGLYLFRIFNNRPGEQEMDPFYSVDMETGEFKEFSMLTDGDMGEITSLFTKVGGDKRWQF